jgi:pSer/pThr/pTyr-binding forkhead associated (FHA) protein
MAACPKCGFDNRDDANFCNRCGSRLVAQDTAETTVTYAPTAEEAEAAAVQPVEGRPTAVLVIRAGGGREGELVDLDTDLLTIGRNPENQLFLDDVTVSRQHARVIRDATGFVIEDLNSLNGTYVNRRRVERHHLSDGDELQIGKYKLGFLEAED